MHESDPQRPVYPTSVGPNATDESEQNDCDEADDVRNEDNDVLEKNERNDDGECDDDFVSISTDGWEIEEDYWESVDENDDPDYDPHERIERRKIVKNRSEKHHPLSEN
jgi:hypothetical protein